MKDSKSKKLKPSGNNKRNLIVGLSLIIISFVCMIVVFYFMVDNQMTKSETIEVLEEELDFVSSEKKIFERKAADLESKVGRSLNIDKIITEARKIHGEDEQSRNEGHLWIDRKSKTLLVTLGALNGLSAGSRIAIYDGDKQVGHVRVEFPMDVISYVKPINKSLGQFEMDHYRAIFEQ